MSHYSFFSLNTATDYNNFPAQIQVRFFQIISAVDLYRVALTKGVAICPGDPFYEKARNVSTFRINYSNSSDEVIEKGIRLLGEACEELLAK